MTFESQAFQTSVQEVGKRVVDWGTLQPIERGASTERMQNFDQVVAMTAAPILDLQGRFRALLNSPEAENFNGFFEHIVQKASEGEPLYQALLGMPIEAVKKSEAV